MGHRQRDGLVRSAFTNFPPTEQRNKAVQWLTVNCVEKGDQELGALVAALDNGGV